MRVLNQLSNCVIAAVCLVLLSVVGLSGCSDDGAVTEPTSTATFLRTRLLACYGGPNNTFPPGTCSSTPQGFEPGGPISVTECATTFNGSLPPPALSAIALTPVTLTQKFTKYCGGTSTKQFRVVRHSFTVADYNAMKASPFVLPDIDGNYSVVAQDQPNTQQVYFYQSKKINGTQSGAGVVGRRISIDGAHILPEILGVPSAFEFYVHIFGSNPNDCHTGYGAITFNEVCMDSAIAAAGGLGPNHVLFEISFLKCN